MCHIFGLQVLRGHTASVRNVSFSPSGRHIASSALNGEIKMWSAINGSQVGQMVGHSLPINSLAFSPRGHELVTAADDHKVKVSQISSLFIFDLCFLEIYKQGFLGFF